MWALFNPEMGSRRGPLGSRCSSVTSAPGVQKNDIDVANQAQMLKSVVQYEPVRVEFSEGQRAGGRSVRPDHNGTIRFPGQQGRLVAGLRCVTPEFSSVGYDEQLVSVLPSITSTDECNSLASLRQSSGQESAKGRFARSAHTDVAHAGYSNREFSDFAKTGIVQKVVNICSQTVWPAEEIQYPTRNSKMPR